MKKLLLTLLVGFAAMTLITGCLDLQLGGGTKSEYQNQKPTLGQQLIDLQRAKDSGAMTDAEYQAEKAKLLGK